MEHRNKNGFTLVELLAVIVILAIILIIAVPGVLTIIDNSRKDSLISTAKTIKDATRLFVTTDDTVTLTGPETVRIPLDCIEMDISQNGFGQKINDKKSYIDVQKQSNNKFIYHLYLNTGGAGQKIVDPTKKITELQRGDVIDATVAYDFDNDVAPAGTTKAYCEAHKQVVTP